MSLHDLNVQNKPTSSQCYSSIVSLALEQVMLEDMRGMVAE